MSAPAPKKSRAAGPGRRPPRPLPAEPAPAYQLDAIDHQLLELLRADGRTASRELARQLGLTEATVRARLRRLEETDTMRIVAITDLRVAGYELMASVGVQVKGRPAAEVAADIAKLPQVLNVHVAMGSSDIELSVAARDREELSQLLTETLVQLPGVHKLSTGMALDVLKMRWGWVPFL